MGKKGANRVRVKQVGGKAPVNPLEGLAIPPEEMIHLPPKKDSNISIVWPITQSFSLDYSKFHAIYPTYIDSNKTVKKGRRIASKDAIPDPLVTEIGEALQRLNIRHVIQPYKGYSRDVESRWDNPGRVLLDLNALNAANSAAGNNDNNDGVLNMDSTGAFDADDIDAMPIILDEEEQSSGEGKKKDSDGSGMSKRVLCRQLAHIIPNLPSRIRRLEEKKKALEEQKRKEAQQKKAASSMASGTAGGSGTGGSSSKKKKGKKKR